VEAVELSISRPVSSITTGGASIGAACGDTGDDDVVNRFGAAGSAMSAIFTRRPVNASASRGIGSGPMSMACAT